jgi:hypothetical protein
MASRYSSEMGGGGGECFTSAFCNTRGTQSTLATESEERACSHRGILFLKGKEDSILRGPRSSSFWVPRNLSHHMIRQACFGDTVLVKSRKMTGRNQTLPCWLGGRRGKDEGNKIQ